MPLTRNKSNKIYDVEYFVVWNADRRTFDVQQGDAETGVFARDKITAIGLAKKAAQIENQAKTAVVYSFNSDGKLIVEWSA